MNNFMRTELNDKDFEKLAVRLKAIRKSCEKENRKRTDSEEFFVKTVNGQVYDVASSHIDNFVKSIYKNNKLIEAEDIYDTCVMMLFEEFPNYRANTTLVDFLNNVLEKGILREREGVNPGKHGNKISDEDFAFYASKISEIKRNCKRENRGRTEDEKFFVKKVNEKLYLRMSSEIKNFVARFFEIDSEEYKNLFDVCVIAMFDNFPKYRASENMSTYFKKAFNKAKKMEENRKIMINTNMEEVLKKNADTITNSEFELLAREIDKIRKMCKEDSNRKRTAAEEAFVKQVNGKLFEKIDKYIRSFVHRTYPNYYKDNKEEFQNLCDVCIITMFDHFPEYRSNIDLTVFFARWFKGECNTYLGQVKGKSRYFNNKSNIINKAIKELIAKGFSEAEITVTDIHKQLLHDKVTNISPTVISNTLSVDNIKIEPLSDNDNEKDSFFTVSPETTLLNKETEEQIKSILSILTPAERIAFLLNVGYYDDETGFIPTKSLTAKQISMYPKFLTAVLYSEDKKNIVPKKGESYDSLDEDLKEYFTDKVSVSADFVVATIAKARKKIKNHPLVLERYDKASDTYGVYASEEDVMSSVQSIEDILKDM